MIAALFDHLWQSTLFACAAGLLVLALRRHSARARYWVWFAASVKFLIPFSLLESAGSWLAPRAEAPVVSQPVADAVNWISTPFLAAIAPTSPTPATHLLAVAHAVPATHALAATAPTAAAHVASQLLPHITAWLAAAWLAGTIVVVAVWAVRWIRLSTIVRMARTAEMAAPVPVKVTSARIEPGLVGITRPVLLLPDGLAAHLSAQEIGCLIAHEVSHLRRRDNLTAAVHMIVEAAFWFYPLTWWLETRLIAERERACDESVLASGHDPQAYAQGILKVCRTRAIHAGRGDRPQTGDIRVTGVRTRPAQRRRRLHCDFRARQAALVDHAADPGRQGGNSLLPTVPSLRALQTAQVMA